MEVLWKIENVKSPLTSPYYNLIIHNEDIYYTFIECNDEAGNNKREEKNIGIYKINSLTGKYLKNIKSDLSQEYFNDWYYDLCLFINNNDIILCAINCFNKSRKYLNISSNDVVIMPDQYEKTIINKEALPYANYRSKYRFGDLEIKETNTFIECYNRKSEKSLWRYYLPKLKKSAFASGPRTERICTEIVLKNNYLIFGTFADVNMFFNNYYFHCIELLTGIEKNKKIQVGAGCHTWYNDTLFANGLEGNLLQLNLLENKIVQQIEFKEGKMSKNSPITIFDNKICTLVKNEEGQSSIIFLKQ